MRKRTIKPGLMRTSERGDFKTCQWKWWVVWVLGLTSSRSPTWAWFGTAVHKAMEVRYPLGRKRGHMADVIAAFEESVGEQTGKVYTENESGEEEVVDALALGRAMLLGYENRWGRDQHWEIIHSEQPFQIDVHHPKTGELLVVYCGTFDMIVYDRKTKRFYVVDHKTRKTFPRVWTFYDINDQAGSYLWVAPEVLEHLGVFSPKRKKDRLSGIIFNALKKSLPDERPRNEQDEATNKPQKGHYVTALAGVGLLDADGKPLAKAPLPRLASLAAQAGLTVYGDVSAKQPGERYHRYTSQRGVEERVRQAQHVADEAKQMDRVRRGIDNPTKNKTEDCIRCPLFDMCQLDEVDPLQGKEYAAALMYKRDPYADHREAMKLNGVKV